MQLRKILAPILAVALLVGIGGAIYVSSTRKLENDAAQAAAKAVVQVRGMIGSEKETYFLDPRVQARLKQLGFTVTVDKVGSREISARKLDGYDFGFPAGAPAAITLQKAANARQVYQPFFTPMAIASWKTLVPVLEHAGLVRTENGTHYIIDMDRLMRLIAQGKRWNDLPDNTVFNTSKSILVSSTDVRKSNSGAMYLALASYVLNDSNIVNTQADADRLLPALSGLFLRQGLQESSSAGPFEDYTTMGIGKAPMVMIYESQFLEYQSKRATPNTDMVLLYPRPTLYTKHTLVPFTEAGQRLGEALAQDPELQALAVQFGYRTADNGKFTSFLADRKLSAPDVLVDVVDPPSYETLEYLIQGIERQFN
ncbi:hypothetical protein [Bordetella genomosp. 13]|uniref:hypothetical protein n=1 Tax=Bordetella genomosp. 13 TaxID=463040 RepID=UPI0011A2A803|nr:hypothetical protein [Bordetella genomosp. 13]